MELATDSDEEDDPDHERTQNPRPIRAHDQQAATSRSGLRARAKKLSSNFEIKKKDISRSTYENKVKQVKVKANSGTQDKITQIRSSILSLTKVNTFFN